MEFLFKPEKLSEDLKYQVSETLAKRTELFSRKKFPGLWEKTDELNEKNLSAEALKRRRKFRRFYGIICIALGIFLFVPGFMKPGELFVPLVVGALAILTGITAVVPRKTNSEKFEKKAKKLISAIDSSLKPGNKVLFNEEGIFENGALLMEYENLESIIENRSVFLVCDGIKIMVLRKTDLVIGNPEEFKIFVESKTGKKTEKI